MADKRRVAITSGRVASGSIGIAVALVAVVAVGQLDLPVSAVDAPGTTVTPTASDQSRICAGPLLRLGDDAASAGAASAFAPAGTTIAADTVPAATSLLSPDNLSGDAFGLPSVVSVASEPGEAAPPIAAAQSQTAALDDLSGFAATACGEPSADSWIVGGSTDVGRTSVLSLTNPTRTDAIIDLSFFSEAGEIDAPGARGVIVKAGEQRLLALAGFAPGVRAPVIRVQSTGGQVSAVLQQTVVRGITPGGVELTSATTPPGTQTVIPGMIISPTSPVAPDAFDDTEVAYDDSIPAIRVFVPGTESASVSLAFVSESGAPSPEPLGYTLDAGVVSEVTLAEIPAGRWSVEVTSDLPLVAGVRTTAGAGESSDFAWFGATAPLDDETVLAVAPGPLPILHLYNPTATDREIVLTDRLDAETTVTVAAGESVATAVRADMSYRMSGTDGIHAQVSFEGGDGFSAYGIQPASPSASPVTVYPR